MSDSNQPASPSIPPHAQLIQMGTAYWVSRIVYAAAKLGIADKLASGPKEAKELAAILGVHAPSLFRFMRTLASLGLISLQAGWRYGLTPLGEALRADAPGAARATILTVCSPFFSGAFDQILYSIETGKTGFEKVYGMPVFDFLGQHPEEASLFSETMVGIHGAEPLAVAEAYDFSEFDTVVDVGGATGNMLAAILSRHARPRGILFDMPHVVRDAPALLKAKGVSARVSIESGSFFETVPKGGDAYILSHIIHDWSEDQCVAILGHVRKAMKPDGRVLIVEMVLPSGDEPHPGKLFDMVMLVLPGGEERTEADYGALLHRAGLRLTRVVPTKSAVSVIEATLV